MASSSWFYRLAEANLHFMVTMQRNAMENLNYRLNWNKIEWRDSILSFLKADLYSCQILINSLHGRVIVYLARTRQEATVLINVWLKKVKGIPLL